MTDIPDSLRTQLARLLDWGEAHVTFEKAVDGLQPDLRGAIPPGFEHSPWQLLEHMRIAQKDILDFCVNANYVHALKWPEDYWPSSAAPARAEAWSESVGAFKTDRAALKHMVLDRNVDLLSLVPTGKDAQTYLRSVMLAADHNAYHLGQLIAVRKALGAWG
jgi:uncharacterized damage-inducible protein DinB